MLPYISVIPPLTFDQFSLSSNNLFSAENNETLIPFNYGRDALWAGLGLLGLGKEDEVLMPAAMCDVVLRAFLEKKISLQYYSLNNIFGFNPNDIESRITPNTKAIYVNHFLGRVNNLFKLRELCDSKGLYLIEDCAHAFYAQQSGIDTGSTGDIAIFSYRKFLPIAVGGGLKVNLRHILNNKEYQRESFFRSLSALLKMGLLRIAENGWLPISYWKLKKNHVEALLDVDEVISVEDWKSPRLMSKFSRWLTEHANMERIRKKRRDNYLFLTKGILDLGGGALFPTLEADENPYALPILVENRDRVIRYAASKGVFLEPTIAPPFSNMEIVNNRDESFSQIEEIASKLLCLPVHQSLSKKKLTYILEVMKEGLNSPCEVYTK